ncbi:putative arginyltransferase [Helianthus debilis subsp. tardiflorus]
MIKRQSNSGCNLLIAGQTIKHLTFNNTCTCKWVPFDIAKRLLDRKSYVVLSDFAILLNELSLLPNASEDQIEEEEDYESNDVRVDEDEEMFEGSDDDELVGPETATLIPAKMRKDTNNIVIGFRVKHLKYKVLFFFPFCIWSWKTDRSGVGLGQNMYVVVAGPN